MTADQSVQTTVPPCRDEGWQAVPEIDGCTFSGYECSDMGNARSIDRTSGQRRLRGKQLATRRDDDGYVLVNIRCDSTDQAHNRVHTFLMHKLVLTTFDRPCPDGMECRHSSRGPAFNWWPEGIQWGTKAENHADQVAAGTATIPDPTFPCLNAPTCGNMVRVDGRRCRPCVVRLGVDAAALLDAGQPLAQVAGGFGLSQQWIYRVAVEHGGYAGSPAAARGDSPCPRCEARAERRRWILRVVTLGLAGRR